MKTRHGQACQYPVRESAWEGPGEQFGSRDPVGSGLLASLARRGGNVTGLSAFATQLTSKRLELLKRAMPTITRVAAIGPPTSSRELQETEVAASALGVRIKFLEAHTRLPSDHGSRKWRNHARFLGQFPFCG